MADNKKEIELYVRRDCVLNRRHAANPSDSSDDAVVPHFVGSTGSYHRDTVAIADNILEFIARTTGYVSGKATQRKQ